MIRKRLEKRSEIPTDTGREVTVYTLTGSLMGAPQSCELQDEVRDRITDGARRIVLNLEGVTKIDSAGAGIPVSLMRSGSQEGANLVFAALPAAVETMLGIAVLLDRIDHPDSRATAIAMVDRA